jgi:hypothetical protein
MYFNHYFAYGNVILIALQLQTFYQSIFMFMLIWDTDFYLYTLKIWRIINFVLAILFVLFYFCLIAYDYDMVFIHNYWTDDHISMNGFTVTILSYMIILWIPTFLVNFNVCIKELTLNQFAWSKEEELTGGLFYYFDPISWMGMEEDPNVYADKIKAYGREFW